MSDTFKDLREKFYCMDITANAFKLIGYCVSYWSSFANVETLTSLLYTKLVTYLSKLYTNYQQFSKRLSLFSIKMHLK